MQLRKRQDICLFFFFLTIFEEVTAFVFYFTISMQGMSVFVQ